MRADVLANRQLQSVTCKALLVQRALLEQLLTKMDGDFGEWSTDIRKAIRTYSSSHKTFRMILWLTIVLHMFCWLLTKNSQFVSRCLIRNPFKVPSVFLKPTMFVNPRAVGTTGNRADETWRAGWPESADLFWTLAAAPWQTSFATTETCFI